MSYTEEDVNAVLCLYFAYAKVCWTKQDTQTKEVITNVLSYAQLHSDETLTYVIPEEENTHTESDNSWAYNLVCRVHRYLREKTSNECKRMKLSSEVQLHCLRKLQDATDWVMSVFQILDNERKYIVKQQFTSCFNKILDSSVV